MITSYFAKQKEIREAGYIPVSIARQTPTWFLGQIELTVAPSWRILKVERQDYDPLFSAQLATVNARELFARLGDKACLCCWERPLVWCHRRMVAEWLEKQLGIEVTEFGYKRSEVPHYRLLPSKPPKETKKKEPKPEPEMKIPTSFQLDFFGIVKEEDCEEV